LILVTIGDLKDRLKNVAPIFERKIWGRLLLQSDYQRQDTNMMGQFIFSDMLTSSII